MPSIKQFVYQSIQDNPKRYGIDKGDLNLINDYFISQNWKPLMIEQHKAIAGLIRKRNEFLTADGNSCYDLRSKASAYEHIGQTSIYDFLEEDTRVQLPKIVKYWSVDATRYSYSNSRIKKSIRGINDEHIVTARVMLPLLIANPLLKQKRVKKSTKVETAQSTNKRTLNNIFNEKLETNFKRKELSAQQ